MPRMPSDLVNPGVTPDAPDSMDQLRPGKARRPMPPKRPPMRPSRPVNPGVTPDQPDSMAQLGMKKGGSVGKASSRADGIAKRGKTRGKMI